MHGFVHMVLPLCPFVTTLLRSADRAVAVYTGNPVYEELCTNVSVSDGDVGNNMCLPNSSNLTVLSFSQAREMKLYYDCIGEANPDCEQVGHTYTVFTVFAHACTRSPVTAAAVLTEIAFLMLLESRYLTTVSSLPRQVANG